ncbi:hypothetical protein SSAG_00750 [Streptomyces sp. Mg1]|nr:hypothetical protein SSAG_00750 [Streptomyces sp. Mg1]
MSGDLTIAGVNSPVSICACSSLVLPAFSGPARIEATAHLVAEGIDGAPRDVRGQRFLR